MSLSKSEKKGLSAPSWPAGPGLPAPSPLKKVHPTFFRALRSPEGISTPKTPVDRPVFGGQIPWGGGAERDGGATPPRDLVSQGRLLISGAGVAGLCAAVELTERGVPVAVSDAAPDPRLQPPVAASWLAGGMLAPWCEGESAPEPVVAMGERALEWWSRHVPVTHGGTLVVAPSRDRAELDRFAAMTRNHRWLNADEIAALEPDLAGRFTRALFFAQEAHLDPSTALLTLIAWLENAGVPLLWNTPAAGAIDCRGLAANLPDLRPVRGEMIELATDEIRLNRPVRLLHPRTPIYIVPREPGRFMVGATMVENDHAGAITLRAAVELMSAAFALHPAFAESRLIRSATGLRPAFPDNIPAIRRDGARIHINGMYRHGYLCAPALAEALAAELTELAHAG